MIIHANVPRKRPKKVWLKDTFAYLTPWLDSNPREADEKIRKPPMTRMAIDIKKGMSIFIFFIIFNQQEQ